MANYFYTDAECQQKGPISEEQLKELVAQGIIEPDMTLETDAGNTILAGKVPRLFFEDEEEESESFDIGFIHFLTPVLVTIVWWFSVFVTFITVIVITRQVPEEARVGSFFVCIIIGLLNLLFTRLVLEFFVIAFRTERHLRTICDKYENK